MLNVPSCCSCGFLTVITILPNNEILTHVLGLQHVYSLSRIHFLEPLPRTISLRGNLSCCRNQTMQALNTHRTVWTGEMSGMMLHTPCSGSLQHLLLEWQAMDWQKDPQWLTQASARSTAEVTFPFADPSLAYQQSVQISTASNICYTCNTSFKNATILATTKTNSASTRLNGYALAVLRRSLGCKKD